MKDKKSKIIFLHFALPFCIGLFAAAVAIAQSNPVTQLILKGSDSPLAPDSEVVVTAFVESAEDVNAFSATIAYPAEMLKFRSADTANSIINFWARRPASQQAGLIAFEGGIIGEPFRGRGELVTMRFDAQAEGSGAVRFIKTQVLLADGKGTSAATLESSAQIIITAGGAPLERAATEDFAPPAITIAEIIRNPSDNAPILVFQIEERESGLRSSDVRFREWFAWGNWQEAENQAGIPQGAWQMQVRAVDNYDNEVVETLTRGDVFAKKAATWAFGVVLIAGGALAVLRRKNYIRGVKL